MKLSLAFSAAAQAGPRAYPTQWAVPQSTLDLPSQQLEEVVNVFKLNLSLKSYQELSLISVREAIDAVSQSENLLHL